MDENEVLDLKGDSTTLSTGRKRRPWEKPRKLFIWWYWYMYYDGSKYKDIYIYIYIYEVFDDKILISHKLWICCKNYLFERFVPTPQCLWIPLIELSYRSLFHLTDTLEGLLE